MTRYPRCDPLFGISVHAILCDVGIEYFVVLKGRKVKSEEELQLLISYFLALDRVCVVLAHGKVHII
jgi:hypothetical protein